MVTVPTALLRAQRREQKAKPRIRALGPSSAPAFSAPASSLHHCSGSVHPTLEEPFNIHERHPWSSRHTTILATGQPSISERHRPNIHVTRKGSILEFLHPGHRAFQLLRVLSKAQHPYPGAVPEIRQTSTQTSIPTTGHPTIGE
ncbi:hypothetical protein NDU88_004212 [Pleurodeles waltl]|uniref:Uncharacterized protein n=1 Tax=Pleurodeles waltl TaxID=8319 RepID=A0AAV7QE47_PLEWA|nr:hypothetical protein NDU88_004212 [Pleurodeles waltl]